MEDIDPDSFGYAFSVGRVARAGAIDMVDKEARLPPEATDAEVRARLVAALRARAGQPGDGLGSAELIRATRPYARKDGTMGEREFRCGSPCACAPARYFWAAGGKGLAGSWGDRRSSTCFRRDSRARPRSLRRRLGLRSESGLLPI